MPPTDEVKAQRATVVARKFLRALKDYPFVTVVMFEDDIVVYVKNVDPNNLPPKVQAFLASLEEFDGEAS